MEKNYSYFIEKAGMLIHALLIGKGPAKQRLRENEGLLFGTLFLDIPDEFKNISESILDRLTRRPGIKHDDKTYMTPFRDTMIYMKNETASKIIQDIYLLYSETKRSYDT